MCFSKSKTKILLIILAFCFNFLIIGETFGACGRANGQTYKYNNLSLNSYPLCSGIKPNYYNVHMGNKTWNWLCTDTYCNASWAITACTICKQWGDCTLNNGVYTQKCLQGDYSCEGGMNGSYYLCNDSAGHEQCGFLKKEESDYLCSSYGKCDAIVSEGRSCSLNPINGVCNSTHYNCNVGTSINNLQGGLSWDWQCQGSDGGTTVTCSQNFPTCTYNYGSWGACINGTQTRTATAANSPCIGTPITSQSCIGSVNGDCNNTCAYCCSSGYAVNHYNSGVYYQWNCSGLNGGSISGNCRYRPACTWSCGEWGACQSGNIQYRSCSQSPLGCNGENPYSTSQSCTYTPACTWSCGEWGVCQSNNTQYRTCSSSPSGCVGNNPYSTTQNCVYSIAGACGTANNKTYAYNETSYGSDTQCASGTSSNTAFPAQGSIVIWTCIGSGGGETRSCAAGRNPVPIPVNGVCGTANNKTYAYNETSYGSDTQCASGTSSNTAFPAQNSIVIWTCIGSGGGETRSCATGRNPAFVNGVCGTANLKTYPYDATSYGSDTQCASGTPSNTAFPIIGGITSWYCNGINGGTSSLLCAASRVNSN